MKRSNYNDPRQQLSSDDKDSWRIFRIMAEFVEGFEVMAPVGRAVSIFGSARSRPDDPFFKQAEETARLLAKENFAVITGVAARHHGGWQQRASKPAATASA